MAKITCSWDPIEIPSDRFMDAQKDIVEIQNMIDRLRRRLYNDPEENLKRLAPLVNASWWLSISALLPLARLRSNSAVFFDAELPAFDVPACYESYVAGCYERHETAYPMTTLIACLQQDVAFERRDPDRGTLVFSAEKLRHHPFSAKDWSSINIEKK